MRYAPHSKRISAGPGPEIYEVTFEPTDLQWQALEDALNTKRNPKKTPMFRFSKKTGQRVQAVCMLFAIFGTGTTVPIHATVLKIEKWLDQTHKLQIALGPQPKTKKIPKNRMDLQKTYFSPLLAKKETQYFLPIRFLKNVLDAAIASGELVQRTIKDPTYPETRQNELWFIWVAALAKILSKAGVKVSAASSDKSPVDSPFVNFIQTIQTMFPEKYYRRKTPGSIAKAIQDARKRYAGLEILDLLTLLMSFVSERDYEKQPLNIKDPKSKQRLERFFSQISSQRGTSPGNGTA